MLVCRVRLVVVVGFVLALQVGVSAGPAGAVEIPVSVATSAEYVAALATAPCDAGNELVITLTGDITLGAEPVFAGDCDLTIKGGFFTLDGGDDRRSVVGSTGTGTVTIENVVAINGDSGDDGGAVNATGPLVVKSSEFRDNTAVFLGGAIRGSGTVNIADSTFTGNAVPETGAIQEGGAVRTGNALPGGEAATISNSTFFDNSSGDFGGAVTTYAHLTVTHSTFASNSAELGAHLDISFGDDTLFGVSMSTPLVGENCWGPSDVASYTRSTDGSCVLGAADGNADNAADPLLGVLGDNGGPTRTMVPAVASPLVDAIPSVDCSGTIGEDQRGVVRPQGGMCDVGAVERFVGAPPVVTAVVSGDQRNGVYTSDVTISWDVTDTAVYGPPGVDPCPDETLTTDTWPDGMEFSCSASNDAGTTTETVNIIRDTRPPFYVLVDATGFVYAFPEDFNFGRATVTPGSQAIDIDINPQATGYYILDSAGVVHPVGNDVVSQGNFPTGLLRPGEQIVALSLTETGLGYWIFTSGGQAVPFGDAPDIGDVADLPLQGAIVDGTPFPPGFYMAGADGGLFTPPGTNGDVPFFGSVPGQLPGVPLNEPVVTIYTDTDGKGYSMAAGDGGMFNFESIFCGSIPGVLVGVPLNQPVVNAVPFGDCYIFFAADGGAFVFGDLPFLGSVPGRGISVDNITSGDAFGT